MTDILGGRLPVRADLGFADTLQSRTEDLIPRVKDEWFPVAPDSDFDARIWLESEGIDSKGEIGKAVSAMATSEEQAVELRKEMLRSDALAEMVAKLGILNNAATDPLVWLEVMGAGVVAKGATLARQAAVGTFVPKSRFRAWSRNAALGDLVAQGSGNSFKFLNDLSQQADLGDAAAQRSFDQVVSSITAYGLGGVFGGTADLILGTPHVKASVDYMKTAAKNLHGPADVPLGSVDAPSVASTAVTDPYGFAKKGRWFTDSALYKLVPAGMKSALNSKAPDFVKGLFVRIGNNGSLLLRGAEAGQSIPPSIFMRQGNALAKFGAAMEELGEIYGRFSSMGDSTIAGAQISRGMAHIKKMAGKRDETFGTFSNDAARQRIMQNPNVSAETKETIEVIEKYFHDIDVAMNDAGVSHFLKEVEANTALQSSAAVRKGRLAGSIGERAANRMKARMTSIRETIADLESDLISRGLTPKQQKFYDDLVKTKGEYDVALKAFDDAVDFDDKILAIQGLDLSRGGEWIVPKLAREIEELRASINTNAEILRLGRHPDKEPYWPRVFNKRAIESRTEEFVGIISEKILKNPDSHYYVWDDAAESMVRKDWVGMSAVEVDRRVKSIVREILDGSFDEVAGSAPSSRHFMRRKIPVENSEIIEFIVTDAREVMLSYGTGTGRKIEWAKEFGQNVTDPKTGKSKFVIPSIEDIKSQADAAMLAEGRMPLSERDMLLKDLDSLYQRVVGRVRDNPDTWDVKAAEVLRSLTQWTYLGAAGISAAADFSNLLMDHELKTLSKGLISMFDDYGLGLAGKELRMSGDGLEYLTHTYHTRFLETLSGNPLRNGWTDKINAAYYKLNLLEPMTLTAKSMDAMFRGHTIITPAIKLAKGQRMTKWEVQFLARYGIDKDLAVRIAAQPFERTRSGLIMPNTTAWTDAGATEAFRIALKNGVMNRVIMGTPADKPMMMSGKVYIPMRIAKQVGLKEDPKVRGYAKIENGLLALPLTFYSFSLGAINNITANYAQGTVRNQTAHFAMAMFMGYQLYLWKTEQWQRDQHSLGDKVARSLDYSGLGAIYSDAIYRMIESADAFGVDTPISPRFRGNKLDTAIQFGGAPAEYGVGVIDAARNLIAGDRSEGAKSAVYSVPFGGLIWLRGMRNNLAKGLGSMLEEE